jgi:hypothetical protein
MLVAGKKCWARSVKKWLLQNQPQKVVGFLPLAQSLLETTLQLAATHALQAGTTERWEQFLGQRTYIRLV